MSFMREIWGEFVDGIVNGGVNHREAAPAGGRAGGHGRIERLCRELGWAVDEREGNVIRLHLSSADGEMRKVRITRGDESLVGFFVPSEAVLPARRVPPKLMAYLLSRNLEDSGIGMWGINVDDDDDATFVIYYMALGDGLTAQTLEYICESLAAEAAHVDDKLRRAGLLD